jgi:hypothetical protein
MKNNSARIVVENVDALDLSELPKEEPKKRGRPKKKVEQVVEQVIEPVFETLADPFVESVSVPVQNVQPVQSVQIVEPIVSVQPEIDPETLTILDQVKLTFSKKNTLALFIGLLWAGGIPIFSFIISHYETNIPDLFNGNGWDAKKILMSVFVLGALAFSFKSTYDFGKKIFFGDAVKAFGSTLILEGVLIFSGIKIVSILSLILVVSANIVNAAVNMVVKKSNSDVDRLLNASD